MAGSPDMQAEREAQTTPGENPILHVLRRPRIMLILLGLWNILIVIGEIFIDLGGGKIQGPIGGANLTWQAVPLTVLYLYCLRDPIRYSRVFWLALIQMASAIAANFYHLGAGDVKFEAIIIPVTVSAGLGILVFLHIFEPKQVGEQRAAGVQ